MRHRSFRHLVLRWPFRSLVSSSDLSATERFSSSSFSSRLRSPPERFMPPDRPAQRVWEQIKIKHITQIQVLIYYHTDWQEYRAAGSPEGWEPDWTDVGPWWPCMSPPPEGRPESSGWLVIFTKRNITGLIFSGVVALITIPSKN